LHNVRVKFRAAAQSHVALQQKLGYELKMKQRRSRAQQVRIVMTNAPFEIPNELRDFAERSVDQARKAFEGFVSVAQKAAGTVDGAAETTQDGVKSVASQVFGFAEQNVNAAFDLAHKLVQAKDPQEAFALQSEFLKTQLSSLQAQAKEIGALIQKATPGAK
jgi:phasin